MIYDDENNEIHSTRNDQAGVLALEHTSQLENRVIEALHQNYLDQYVNMVGDIISDREGFTHEVADQVSMLKETLAFTFEQYAQTHYKPGQSNKEEIVKEGFLELLV